MRKYLIIALLFTLVLTGMANSFTTIEGVKYPDDLVFKMPDIVEEAECLEVLDGRTIRVKYTGLIEKEKTVELIGVDVSQFESSAKTVLENLIEGKRIFLSYGWQGEANNKVRAYVWRHFAGITGGYNLMLNAVLLANGYAVVDTEEHIEIKMAAILDETSHTAMQLKLGELKQFASEKPMKYAALEEEIKNCLYIYYWKAEPVAKKAEDTAEITNQGTGTYFMTKTGDKYHLKDCSTIEGKELLPISKEDAERLGYEPCNVCLSNKEIEQMSTETNQVNEETNPEINTSQSLKKEAFEEAKFALKNILKSPNTAKFHPYEEASVSIDKLSGNYKVTGFVDAENSFGGYSEMLYSVELKLKPERLWGPANINKWEVIDVITDD